MTSPLRTVLLKHEDELMGSLKSIANQCAFGLLTVTNPISGRFAIVQVNDMLNQQGMDLFLKREFALAIVGGRHRPFSV